MRLLSTSGFIACILFLFMNNGCGAENYRIAILLLNMMMTIQLRLRS